MTYELDRESMGYLYEKVAAHLAQRIKAGELAPSFPLPAETRLALEYGVSLGTARRAVELLREQHLVVTLRSKGSFVIDQAKRGDLAEGMQSCARCATTNSFSSASHRISGPIS